MAAVQCYGIKEVVDMANNRQCPAWAIFQGKQFLFKCEEQDQRASISFLNDILSALNRSEAIYCIQFYEDLKPGEKIKTNTPYDGSFNFKLIEPEIREGRMIGMGSVYNNTLALEERIKKLEAEKEEAEPETLGAAFINLLQNPAELGILVNVARGALGYPIQDFGSIAGIHHAGKEQEQLQGDEKLQRLGAAIDTLEKKDPQLVQHLEKLASMDEDKLKSMLALFNLQK